MARALTDDYIRAMCGRVIQSGGPLRYAIVDGMNVRDSRVHNYPPRWNAAPSQELLEPILKLPTAVDRITMSNDSAQGRAVGAHRDHFPEEKIADGRPGRKPIPTRCVLEAVLWILNTGAQWHMLPQSYPNYKTVHRRFQTWCRDEVLCRVLTDVANELRDRGALNEEECFIDATFVIAPMTAIRWM